ncbi:hypothetical protein S7335_3305 [Synechococcus sp. PCC 7335]|nr:hypothetical protein S7335_3305 [Synechococcus sp. PCC 7335]
MAPKTITVQCPQCQQVYIDWSIPAVGTVITSSQRPTTVCSRCGNRSILSELSDRNGILSKPTEG